MSALEIPDWAGRVERSSLGYRIAPRADDWRYQLATGNSPFALEVRAAISARKFDFDENAPRLFQYGTDSAVVAHLVIGAGMAPHPLLGSRKQEVYVMLDYLEVAKEFQRKVDPGSDRDETFAAVVLRHAEEVLASDIATRVGLRKKRPVGLDAIVRVGNVPAIRLMERMGYVADPRGAFPDTQTGQASLLFRKLLPGVSGASQLG